MQFDENFLQEMGLSAMPEETKKKFLEYIEEEVEVRIGERISKGLTEVQLNEFDQITDPREAAAWLEKNRLRSTEATARPLRRNLEYLKGQSTGIFLRNSENRRNESRNPR